MSETTNGLVVFRYFFRTSKTIGIRNAFVAELRTIADPGFSTLWSCRQPGNFKSELSGRLGFYVVM